MKTQKHKNGQYLKFFMICLTLIMVFSACSFSPATTTTNIKDMIRAPRLTDFPSEGIWKIETVVDLYPEDKHKKETEIYAVGDKLYLDKNLTAIRDNITVNPNYSTKYVNFDDYLGSQLIDKKRFPYAVDENVNILMARDSDIFSMDLIFLKDGNLCFIKNSQAYKLVKVEDAVSKERIESYCDYMAKKGQSGYPQQKLHMAALFGVEEKRKDASGKVEKSYQSYLIYEDPDLERPLVYRSQCLFLPDRERQPYILEYQAGVVSRADGQETVNRFLYYPLSENNDKKQVITLEDKQNRDLTYAHTNVVSFSKTPQPDGQKSKKVKGGLEYEIRYLDRLDSEDPVSVEQIASPEEYEAFHQQILEAPTRLDKELKIDADQLKINDTNIGIRRANTGWSFVSSLNLKKAGQFYSLDVPIDILPKVNFFEEPNKHLSWAQVTNKQPLAITADCSPQGERVLIQKADEMQYYPMEGKDLGDRPLLSIQLGDECSPLFFDYFYDDIASQIKTDFLKTKLSQPQVIFPFYD